MKEGLEIIHEVTLPSDLASIGDVETLIDVYTNQLQVSEDAYGNILIAVTEAVNNAIIHGNKLNASLGVWMGVYNGVELVAFSVKDQGQGFNPDLVPDPVAPDNLLKENGRGVFLIKSLSDEMEYEDGGTRVNMYFKK